MYPCIFKIIYIQYTVDTSIQTLQQNLQKKIYYESLKKSITN